MNPSGPGLFLICRLLIAASSSALLLVYLRFQLLPGLGLEGLEHVLSALHWVRTCSFSSEKFVITHLLKPVSVSSSDSFSIQLCSPAGEEL